MIRVVAGLMAVILVGCAQEQPILPQVDIFRDPSAQIASQANVSADRMAGRWFIRQGFVNRSRPVTAVTFSTLPNGGLQMAQTRLTCELDICLNVETLVLLEQTGPGRWMPVDPPIATSPAEFWVMWMDFDSRTVAIGTPSGEFGWIMDKSRIGGRDRITAARDIMDWFGYTVAHLQEVEH